MSLTREILKEYEEFLEEKAQLRSMMQAIEELEKHLGKKLRILEEKLAVQELEEKVKAKRAVVKHLKSKKWNIEKKIERVVGNQKKSTEHFFLSH